VDEEFLPGIVQRNPTVGFLIPTRRQMRYVKNAVSLRAEQLCAGPIEQQASRTANPDREAQEAEANPAAGTLVR
jgi:hypothetical protein